MDNIQKTIENQMQSKIAWITAITLIPVTLLAILVFGICLENGLLYLLKIPFGGAVIVFFVGACLDQAAHIYCCLKGNKNGLIMRICASVLEFIGVIWFTIWIAAELFEVLLMFFPVILFMLLICLWRALEVLSIIRYIECLTYTKTTAVIGFFGSVGMILGIIFVLIVFVFWIFYISSYPSLWSDNNFLLGLGFSFIPVYMISLSLHTFSVRDAIVNNIG